jgi:hypothetical protein
MLKSVFTDKLQELGFPCICLNSWNEFSTSLTKPLTNYEETYKTKLMTKYYTRKIYKTLSFMNDDPMMNVVYSFHGKLPSYAYTTVKQLRKFYDGPVYFILDDLSNELVKRMAEDLHVNIVDLNAVFDSNFKRLVEWNRKKFQVIKNLKGRENLFEYTFERFYLVNNLMRQNIFLKNVFFLELDNLIYDDPLNWLQPFSIKDIGYMYDNINRCSSGIFYVKNQNSMQQLINFYNTYIQNTESDLINEMSALAEFRKTHKDLVQILPTHWDSDLYPKETWENFTLYGNSIFDAAAIGIYLGGCDSYHTKGKITKFIKWWESLIDYSIYKYEWKLDSEGRKIPFIQNPETQEWLRLNNLHIHSKDLDSNIS